MNSYIIDTHTLFWYLIQSPRLSPRAHSIFEAATRGEAILIVPAIVLVELLGIYEKHKPAREFLDDLDFFKHSDQFRLLPLDPDDLRLLPELKEIREMHDRLVAASAKALNVPCVTKDSIIVESKLIETIW